MVLVVFLIKFNATHAFLLVHFKLGPMPRYLSSHRLLKPVYCLQRYVHEVKDLASLWYFPHAVLGD